MVDYDALLVPVVIRAGVLELTVSIRTIEDELNEETETFELVLSVVDGPAVTGAVDRVTVSIMDDDEAPVVPELPEVVVVTATLRVSELSVSEGDTATLNIELSEAASEDVTLTLTVVGGSAVESVDYDPLLVPVVIRAGVLELTVSIRTIEDELNEETETFELVLSVVDGPAVTGAVDRVTVSIMDDDEAPVVPVEVGFDPVSYDVGESSGTVELRVSVLSGVLTDEVTLNYATSDGSAVAGTDYALTTGTLTLSSEITSYTFTVKILEDIDVELAEMFTVVLSGASSGVMLTASVATVTILDDEEAPVVLGFRPNEYEVDEDAGEVALTVDVISGVLTQDVTLTYMTEGISARASQDYISASGVPIPTLSAMIPSVTFRIPIVDDSTPEPDEKFRVILSGVPVGTGIYVDPVGCDCNDIG